jgi:hypothetical protein
MREKLLAKREASGARGLAQVMSGWRAEFHSSQNKNSDDGMHAYAQQKSE